MQGGRGEEKSDRQHHRQGQAGGGQFSRDPEAESILPLTYQVWLGVSVLQVNGQNVVKVGHRQVAREPEHEWHRSGKCTQLRAHLRQFPGRATWSLSSVDGESILRAQKRFPTLVP